MPSFDLWSFQNIHLVGIGGCGMSGLAKVLHEMGFKVTGSDIKEGPNTIRLRDLGIKVFIGHQASQVRTADVLVFSSAVSADNPELREAESMGITILKRAEVLSFILNQSKNRIAVAGTHGKTTTTAMLAKVLDGVNLNPTFLIGCDMDYVEGNARWGSGDFAVVEADESDRSFLYLSPTMEVITNIEPDHMENFGDLSELMRTFEMFVEKLPEEGILVMEGENPNNQRFREMVKRRILTYGFDPSNDFWADKLDFNGFQSSYILHHNKTELGKVELSVPGRQNILNSMAAFAIAFELGIDFLTAASSLRSFIGARRRFSSIGEYNGVMIIDDYAHHPTEIRATLAAARQGWPDKRIVAVFQPHRFTRTMLLKDEFSGAFDDADLIIITDVYAASENPIPGISGKTIADILDQSKTEYVPKKETIASNLVEKLKEGDLVLTLGAGDIYTVGKEILARLRMKESEISTK